MTGFDANEVRSFVKEWVTRNGAAAALLNDSFFYFGELGMQEFRTVELMTSLLGEHGFSVEQGISGFPTGFLATYGQGAPVIALHSEYDALPSASQKSGSSTQSPITQGAPGHAEGHNCNGAVLITSALAMRYAMEKFGITGTLKVFGAPAEEQGISRPYFVRDGYFDDVDVAFHDHLRDNFKTDYGPVQAAKISAKFTFLGETAHAAGEPWRARDALDAVVLMDMGMAQYREHMEPEMTAHRVITYGGDQPNIIPAKATNYWYFRAPTAEGALRMFEAGQRIAQGAAMMTQTEIDVETVSAVWPVRANQTTAEVLQRNIEWVGMPEWTEQEHAFARSVQKEIKRPEIGLRTAVTPLSGIAKQIRASNDCGDISWKVPMGRLWFPSNIPDAPFHHWSAGASLATSIAHKGVVVGTIAMAASALEFMMDPALVEQAKASFKQEIGDVVYQPLLPADNKPPLGLNQEIMDKYRPAMEQHYLAERPVFSA